MELSCAAWVDIITHMHKWGSCSPGAEPLTHPCSAGLQLCCLPSIPAPASSLWVCVNFLSYPKSGLHSLPFVPRPSAPREHITWTSQTEPELEWVRTSQSSWSPESCAVLLATHPYVLGKCGLFPGGKEHLPHTAAASSQEEQSICLTQQQAPINSKLSHVRDIPTREGTVLLLGAAHQVTYPSAAPVPPSRCWHLDVGPEGGRQPAGQQLSQHSVEWPCAVAPAR